MELFAGILIMCATWVVLFYIGKAWRAIPGIHADIKANVFDGTGFSKDKILPFIIFMVVSLLFLVIIIVTIGSALSLAKDAKAWWEK